MELKQAFNLLQNTFTADQSITFEAHYWGTFQLKLNTKIDFFAQSNTHPFDQKLKIENDGIYLHRSDEAPFLIAPSLTDFFGNCNTIEKTTQHFDQRKKLEELLDSTDFVVTDFDDPEHFETVEAYLDLIQICDELTGSLFDFQGIAVQEIGDQKEITLVKAQKKWIVVLDKILYDNKIINGLNNILKELDIHDFILATSVNESMQMVIMKLSPEPKQLLTRMGLLV